MEVHNQYLHILLAINSTCLGVTMYLLVCLSIEKYYNQRTVATVYKRSLLIYLGFAVGFTVCFNFPKFLELNSKQFWEADEERFFYDVEISEFRRSKMFIIIFKIPHFLFFHVLPLVIFTVFNILIVWQKSDRIDLEQTADSEQTANQLLEQTEHQNTEHRRQQMTEQNYGFPRRLVRLAPNLLIVGFHIPRTMLTAYEIIVHLVMDEEDKNLEQTWILDLSHTLLILGSSTNTMILLLQENFRIGDIINVFKTPGPRIPERTAEFETFDLLQV
ncbi:uncharacterized protein LOC111716851 [Eurytemora carolleeae]|uniref:uncharacterized protein LOC111716851 n=1 Tax=Eurytemora carolleeae TaxID=1294199 RepID=UPI000C7616E5|nr:uncharacterized protein LOC111716851 [Eurytemora carolleeae]|eukprot:XP_023348124.1 uncharacterized protein LOC111716851 [Eurytemora affinis]